MENRVAKHRENPINWVVKHRGNPINRVAKHRGNRKHRVIIISAHSNYKTQFYEKKDIRFSPICLIKNTDLTQLKSIYTKIKLGVNRFKMD